MIKYFIFFMLATFSAYSIKCGHGNTVKFKTSTTKQCDRDQYDFLDLHFNSEQNNFRIHYTLNGINAVDPTDINQNNIPDYIDSVAYYAELVYDIEINQFGFRKPNSDENVSCNGGDGSFDIYVMALDVFNIYGEARSNFDEVNGEEYQYSFLSIDNNYTDENYFTRGIDALKITLAHEYFHSITYDYPFDDKCFTEGCFALQEMTATAMEKRCFPESKDYLAYVGGYFENTWDYNMVKVISPSAVEAYALSIFIDYLAESQDSWEFLSFLYEDDTDDQHFRILDKFLQARGTTLEEEFVEFSKWCYFSSNNSKDDFGFESRYEFPELKIRQVDLFNSKTEDELETNFELNNFTFAVNRVVNISNNDFFDQDTIDFLVTHHDKFFALSSSTKNFFYQNSYTKTDPNSEDYNLIEDLDLFYGPVNDQNLTFNVFYSVGEDVSFNDYVFPNPVILNDCPKIYIPIFYEENNNIEFEVTFYTSDMNKIYSEIRTIETFNSLKVVSFNSCDIFKSNGIFIYSIDNGNKIDYVKIFVK